MRLICNADSNHDSYNPAAYALLTLTRDQAQRYLKYVWEYWRLKGESDCSSLSELSFYEGAVNYYASSANVDYTSDGSCLPYLALDDHPAMAQLNQRRAAYNQIEVGILCQEDSTWHRLPDAVVFENETDHEQPLLWTEGDRVETYWHQMAFRARPKHSDVEIYPCDNLGVSFLQAFVCGEIGTTDPCCICLYHDRIAGDLCASCHADHIASVRKENA